MKSVLITQSNYIPWKGYFDAINMADEFVIFDEVQFTKRDWRNRNRIVTPHGTRWLTIPISVKGKYHQTINQARVSDEAWASNHWSIIQQFYRKSPYFDVFAEQVEEIYLSEPEAHLSKINERFIRGLMNVLGIETRVSRCEDYKIVEGRNQRLIELCQQVNADVYLTGAAAAAYLDEERFSTAGIEVKWLRYEGYPAYEQQFGAFDHQVSILDLLFNTGEEFNKYMKSFRN